MNEYEKELRFYAKKASKMLRASHFNEDANWMSMYKLNPKLFKEIFERIKDEQLEIYYSKINRFDKSSLRSINSWSKNDYFKKQLWRIADDVYYHEKINIDNYFRALGNINDSQ